jgi:hypothetical protein
MIKMPEKELQNVAANQEWITQILPFCLAVGLSCIGGIVNYLHRIDRSGIAFSIIRLIIEVITSGFVGIVAFLVCDAAGLGWAATGAVTAISGHMGTRALFIVENAASSALNQFIKRSIENGEMSSNAKDPNER